MSAVLFAAAAQSAGGLTVWTDPVVYFKYGKRNRIGTGNALCGYIGAQGDTITVTGTGSGDWKWYATPEAGTVGRTSKAWGLGAAVSGAGTYNAAWVASPSDTYTLTLTHVPTGESITAIAQLDWSIDFEGVTYTAANAYVVAADYDWFSANGGTGARTYLSRTSTDGGCIMVRDGYNPFENYTSSSASMASSFKSGEDTGFVTPTFSDKLVYDPDFLHGDGISALRVEGLTGGNHTLIIPETDYGATIRTLRPAAGCKVARFIGEKGSYANILYVVANDVAFCYNKFYSASGAGQLIFPASQYYRANIYNNELHDSGDAIVSHFLNWNIAGNWGHSLSSDLVKQATDFTSIQPATIDGYISANICTRFPVDLIGGAHPDVVQAYFQGSYSGNIPGTFRIRQNLSTSWYGQFIFGGGGSAPNTFADITVELNCHFGTAANGIGTASKTDDQVIRNNTLLRDIQNSYVSAVAPIIAAGGSAAVNSTVEDNIAAAFNVTTPTGSGSSGTLNNNRNTDLANNQSEYEAMFYAPPASGSGGVQGYDADWNSYEESALGIWQMAAPKKGVAVASGGAMNPDGTYRGSFFPYDPVYPIQLNVVGGVYATHYALTATPSSISEGGSFTAEIELQDGSGNPAVRGWDTVFTITLGGTDSGTVQCTVLAGQSTGSVIITQTGSTGTLTLTPTTDADLVDPSAINVTVGAGSAPTLQALSLSASSVNENVSIGTKVADISNNSAGSDLSVLGTHAAYFDVVETSTDSWDLVTAAALDRETLASADIIIRETLADAIGNPKDTPFTITINNVNEGPTVSQDPIPVSFALLSTDPVDISGFFSDPEGTALTFSEDTPAPAWLDVGTDGVLTPDGTQTAGSYSFDITASDGSLDVTATVSITVAAEAGGGGCRGLALGLVLSL